MKILVVEDEPLIRIGLASLMEEAGFATCEAADAEEAFGLLARDGDIAALVTDVDMPGTMDGIGLARAVRHAWPGIGITVISGKVGVAPGDLPPGVRFFTKPCREDLLITAVRDSLETGGPA